MSVAGKEGLGIVQYAQREPVGSIKMWIRPDSSTPLPDDWLICDGSVISDGDSPFDGATLLDLRSTFPRGHNSLTNANFGSDTNYYMGSGSSIPSGGSGTHSHTATIASDNANHGHSGSTGIIGPGTGHPTPPSIASGESGTGYVFTMSGPGSSCHHNFPTTPSIAAANAAHDHGGSASTNSASNLPPYVDLLYLVKIK